MDRFKCGGNKVLKIIESNKKAWFDYTIEDTFETGIELVGSEVKSLRRGDVNLRDSFCQIDSGEVYLKNCFITPYDKGSHFNLDPKRNRKLLLHKPEIMKLVGKINTKGYTLVVTKLYFKGSLVKAELALAKGKQLHDKRDSLREKDLARQADRDIKEMRY